MIMDENVNHSRDIDRDSRAAENVLRSIHPDRVIEAVLGILRS